MSILSQLNGLPDENLKRFVAVLNEKIEVGRLFNALGHMAAGITSSVGEMSPLLFLQYRDKDGGLHPNISHYPFIVLKAENSNQIRKLRAELMSQELPYTDFTRAMIAGSSKGQLTETEALPELEQEYFGVCFFGDTEALKPLTKRFSLFR